MYLLEVLPSREMKRFSKKASTRKTSHLSRRETLRSPSGCLRDLKEALDENEKDDLKTRLFSNPFTHRVCLGTFFDPKSSFFDYCTLVPKEPSPRKP